MMYATSTITTNTARQPPTIIGIKFESFLISAEQIVSNVKIEIKKEYLIEDRHTDTVITKIH